MKHDWIRIHGSFEITEPDDFGLIPIPYEEILADLQDPPARATQAACAASGPAGGKAGETTPRRAPHISLPCQQPARRQQPAQSLDKSACGSKVEKP
jgi:hypothetical protein